MNMRIADGISKILRDRIKELEAENVRLRQQRDAANAQLDFILENLKCDTHPEQNVSSQG